MPDTAPQASKPIEIWTRARIATMTTDRPYGLIDSGALAREGEKIVWVGESRDRPGDLKSRAREIHDVEGRCITPGLIDCHTHLVYAGNRAGEFEQRLLGATYADIAGQGGGIRATVRATRVARAEELFEQSLPRLRSLMSEGVTAVEIKSGYGLDVETELRMLSVIRRMGETLPVTVVPTYLGAHALPPEFEGKSDAYVDLICTDMIPRIARDRLACAVDAYCETIGFSPAQTERIFQAASDCRMPIRLHAEQFSDQGGAALAARFKALSADHLEYVSEAGVQAMAEAGTVAVLLPGAFYFLRETQVPPIQTFRDKKVPMAVATDCNPGSSPAGSLLLMLNMARTLFRLTPEEALAGATRNAARALRIDKRSGTLETGKNANFVIWDIAHPAELACGIGYRPPRVVYRRGRKVFTSQLTPPQGD